jgi:AraC-like DNA-binding protein
VADASFGQRLGEYLGVEAPPTISAQLVQTSEFAATRLQWAARREPDLVRIERENAFLIFMLRESLPPNPYWVDGRPVRQEHRGQGQFNLLDLHLEHEAEIAAAVDCVSLYVPRAALDVLAEEQGLTRVHLLKGVPGGAIEDPVIWHLSECLVPVLERPEEANALYVERVGLALAWHLLCRYGDQSPPAPPRQRGLASWQERRARDMLMASMTGRITLSELARECSLSRSHFARAFKATTGVAPHQWLLAARIERTKVLLATSAKTIEEIAEECGFADQSHFRRTFVRSQHLTPSNWRLEHQQ